MILNTLQSPNFSRKSFKLSQEFDMSCIPSSHAQKNAVCGSSLLVTCLKALSACENYNNPSDLSQ